MTADIILPLLFLHAKMRLSLGMEWRGARVDESTCLESMRPGNGTVGSNPTLSAIVACYRIAVNDTRGRALCNKIL